MKGISLNMYWGILYVGFFLAISSCSKEPEAHSIINIGDQYELKLHQKLTDKGGLPSLQITTLEPQSCTNSFISHQTIISDQKIKLFLNEIYVEGDCIPGNVFISEEIVLETQKEAIPFEISLKNVIDNKGILYSHDSEFKLVLDEFDGLKISKTQINKVHPKMLWGSFSVSNNDIADQLMQYILGLDNGDTIRKGDYGLFYLAQDGSVVIYDDENEFTFLIKTEVLFNSIKTNVEEFKELDSSLIFQATNYDGSAVNIH